MKKILDMVIASLQNVLNTTLGIIPNVIGGLVVLILGLWIAKLCGRAVGKIANQPSIKSSLEKLTEGMRPFAKDIKMDVMAEKIVYYFVALITLLTATDVMGMDILSQLLSQLVQYIPKLLSAGLMLIIGIYIASVVRSLISTAAKSMGLGPWRTLGNMVFYFLVIAIAISALGQAGVDTNLITANITLIIGGVMLAFSIAYGFAARNILSSMLVSFYGKTHFQVGQVIEVEGIKGVVISIESVSIVLDTGDQHVIIPSYKLHSEKIVIYK